MSMMPLGSLLLSALCLLGTIIPYGRGHTFFSRNTTKFLHLVMDPSTGTLYLGATNFLFQLTSDLAMEEEVSTGPFYDSKDCLPPVTTENCPQAQKADNYNKLLLVNSLENELIVCGSVWQGICEKRRLGLINHILFQPQTPGDTQYVAANDPNISTVGLVGYSKDNVPLLFVGRGYTSRAWEVASLRSRPGISGPIRGSRRGRILTPSSPTRRRQSSPWAASPSTTTILSSHSPTAPAFTSCSTGAT
ncbi:hypothetical protein JRQ81_003333 [Phrynocephalus forsythii]|uniref:Sema domain-containing protein n=1 Tax=Phrynocephalus forsythii TaxID=171643 RepID=A0A9Q0XKD6_9SAUR|nr:hypothetical protein JRQ81_003333 [Phrynocephalus forsythii]